MNAVTNNGLTTLFKVSAWPCGAKVIATDCDGLTALMIACEKQNVDVAKLLLEKKAIVNAVSMNEYCNHGCK